MDITQCPYNKYLTEQKNPEIGNLADNVLVAIEQEKNINQDIHDLKGKVSSNNSVKQRFFLI